MRPQLWLARHGETEWSRDGRHTSSTDVPLTAQGQESARALGARLQDQRFDLVLTSPRRRASDTAALAGFADALADADLVEWGYGEYEGITTAQIRGRVPGWTVWTHASPGGESAEDVGRRADRVVARVRESVDSRALVFAHGHLGRVLAARWIGLEPAAGAHLRLDTGTVSVLGWERESPVVLAWNC